MKAVIHERYGEPKDALRYGELDKPSPKKDEILVKVLATSVNRTDCGFLKAEPAITRLFSGLTKPKHNSLGCELVGEVVEVGEDVSEFKVGDRVTSFDDSKFGGHAEFAVLPEKGMVTKVSKKVPVETAAVILEASHYGYAFIKKAGIKKGDKVMLNGSTGGIGSSVLQILKNMGVYVVATANTRNMKLIKSLGADKVINYEKEDFTKQDEQFDFVFDAVGKSSFKKCKPLLKPKGIYVSSELGDHAQNIFLAAWTPLKGGKKVIFPVPVSKKEDAKYLVDLVEKGEFKPVIDKTYKLKDTQKAFEYVLKGEKTGNVVVAVE